MLRFLVPLALVWAALMPPLFTHGACSSEFDAANGLVESQRRVLASFDTAAPWLQARGLPHSVISAEACRRVKPRFLDRCGSGPLIVVEVPVSNWVCKVYRDDATRIQLQYDERHRLVRIASDMKPFRYLRLPGGGSIDWAPEDKAGRRPTIRPCTSPSSLSPASTNSIR